MFTIGTRVASYNVFGARQTGTVTALYSVPTGVIARVLWDNGNGIPFPISIDLIEAV